VPTGYKVSTPNPADNFTEMLPGDVPLEMIAVPAGEFMMGSDGSDDLIYNPFHPLFDSQYLPDHDSAIPIHKVSLCPYSIGKYPITQAQYKAVTGKNPSEGPFWQDKEKIGGAIQSHPCQCVDWNDAIEFCLKLSEITGKNYHLPSESQWEFACRAGTSSVYFFGDNPRYIHKYAHISYLSPSIGFDFNLLDRSKEEEYWTGFLGGSWRKREPTPNYPSLVGLHKPNAWGLHDMLGSVWEWCQDDWIDGYIGHPNNEMATETGSDLKVIRGGSFQSVRNDCYSFSRSSSRIDSKLVTIGFRVVCTPHPPSRLDS
jgi:formylglycine-generating enzyme required for sulfatase activity